MWKILLLKQKNLFLPSSEVTVITYEYEKIHKRCFSCFRLTHEKQRCPYCKRKHNVAGTSRSESENAAIPKEIVPLHQPELVLKDSNLGGPPGFPPLFPELSEDDQRMALQYISHSDDTERRARIQRVKQSILEAPKVQNVMLKISHDLNKDKGHVFKYNDQEKERSVHARLGKDPALSLQPPESNPEYDSESSVKQNSTSNFKIQGSTVFRLGNSSQSVSTGNLRSKKRDRKRPPALVRRTRTNNNTGTSRPDDVLQGSHQDVPGKRKAESPSKDLSNKSTKTQDNTVASDLKPPPSQ